MLYITLHKNDVTFGQYCTTAITSPMMTSSIPNQNV